MRGMSGRSVALLGLLVAIAVAGVGMAEAAYPERPVKMIVPWAAGGDTDAISRVFGNAIEKQLGQAVVAVNVGGASGTVGSREAKNAPKDGYTILSIHDSIHTTYYTGVADLSYKDFEPICLMTSTPNIVATYGKAPWNSMKELIEDAKKRPEQITVGVSLGSTSHFFPAMIGQAAGVKWKYVSYEGTAPRMTALLGGHIMVGETNLTQLDKVRAGQMKMLAIAADKRSPEVPEVPTLKELGIDVQYGVNRGLVAPKGTPEAVLAKLEGACSKAAKDPAIAESMKKQGTVVRFLGRKDYLTFFQQEDKISGDLAKALGFKRK